MTADQFVSLPLADFEMLHAEIRRLNLEQATLYAVIDQQATELTRLRAEARDFKEMFESSDAAAIRDKNQYEAEIERLTRQSETWKARMAKNIAEIVRLRAQLVDGEA